MIRSGLYAGLAVLMGLQLGGCGGAQDTEQEQQEVQSLQKPIKGCEDLNGQVYYSEVLGEMGETPAGLAMGHWQLFFADGMVSSFQSDFGLSAAYHCEDGQVVIGDLGTEHTELVFSDDYESLTFHPFGAAPITYRRLTARVPDNDICGLVSGKRYVARTEGDAIPIEQAFFAFDEWRSVTFSLGEGGAPQTGIYDCQLGELHVHRSADDTSPIMIDVRAQGERLALTGDHKGWIFERESEVAVCTEQYDPVCAIKPANVQCITTPCPSGFYETFGNACHAGLADAEIAFAGECGSLEGEPYVEPTGCDAQHAPVCAAVTAKEPCLEAPCPAVVKKTFTNRCEAEAARAGAVRGRMR